MLWDVAKKVKRDFGIPRGEQIYYQGNDQMSKSTQVQGAIDITMVRVQVSCSGCGKKQRKYRVCGHCLDAHYCDETCQRGHWKCHKKMCRAVQEEQSVEHEHDYKKVFPNGPRDNNEFDLVCNICGHIA